MNGKPFLTPEMRERLCKYSFTLHDAIPGTVEVECSKTGYTSDIYQSVADHVRDTMTVGYGIPSWTDVPMSPEPRTVKWHGLVHPHDTMEQFDRLQRRFLNCRGSPRQLKKLHTELDKLAMEETY